MKVLNVNPLLDTSVGGGTAERTIQMSYFLNKEGVSCSILTTDFKLKNETLKYLDGVNVMALPLINKRFLVPFPQLKKVEELVKSVDVIHLMNHWGIFNIWVYFLAKKHNKKYVICPAGAQRIFGRSKLLKRVFNLLIGNRIIKNSSYCIAITSDEIKDFKVYGVDENKIIVIPNGINNYNADKEQVKVFKNQHFLENKKVILYVGRLNPIKGVDLLVEAFCQLKTELKDYILLIAGPDEGEKEKLKSRIKEEDLISQVNFLGFINGIDKACAYETADLLVIPSRQEAMSIVVLEAGIVGTPVLLTDQCGLNILGENGMGSVVPASVEGMKKGLLEHLNKSSSQISNESIKLTNFVKNNYIWEKVVLEYKKLYSNL